MFLTISLLFGVMINFWAYLIFFLPIRIFSGGYHGKNKRTLFCFIDSNVWIINCINKIHSAVIYVMGVEDWQG